ncbi:MAG: TrmH family RNA methyltransferase [Minisyncoccota bacterium]
MKKKEVPNVTTQEVVLVLCDIRSVHNVGAIFRTADAAGVARIFCVGYTPTPKDRFGRMRVDLQKTALGAEKSVAWESCSRATTVVRRLKKEGYLIIALEQDRRSVNYKDAALRNKKIALVVGNEKDGVSKNILDRCDKIVEIPMHGEKESLNVSVATGVALFGIFGW